MPKPVTLNLRYSQNHWVQRNAKCRCQSTLLSGAHLRELPGGLTAEQGNTPLESGAGGA